MVDFNVRGWLQKALWLFQCKASERISTSGCAHDVFQVFVQIAGGQVDGFRVGMFADHQTFLLLGAASYSRSWRAAFGVTPLCVDDAFSVSGSTPGFSLDIVGALSDLRQLSITLGSHSVADLERYLPTASWCR